MQSSETNDVNTKEWYESAVQNPCWICGKPTHQINNVPMSHTRFVSMNVRRIKTQVTIIRIPVYICEECRREREETKQKVAKYTVTSGCILGVITAIVAFFLLDREFWTIPAGAIFGFIWGTILGGGGAFIYKYFRSKKYMLGKHSLKEHPAIHQAYTQGYKLADE